MPSKFGGVPVEEEEAPQQGSKFGGVPLGEPATARTPTGMQKFKNVLATGDPSKGLSGGTFEFPPWVNYAAAAGGVAELGIGVIEAAPAVVRGIKGLARVATDPDVVGALSPRVSHAINLGKRLARVFNGTTKEVEDSFAKTRGLRMKQALKYSGPAETAESAPSYPQIPRKGPPPLKDKPPFKFKPNPATKRKMTYGGPTETAESAPSYRSGVGKKIGMTKRAEQIEEAGQTGASVEPTQVPEDQHVKLAKAFKKERATPSAARRKMQRGGFTEEAIERVIKEMRAIP